MATIISTGIHTVAITQDEREFFVALGGRIAHLRKDNQLTQVQLAETLGVAQSTLNAYELGQRRVPVSALPVLARTLAVTLEGASFVCTVASTRWPVSDAWMAMLAVS